MISSTVFKTLKPYFEIIDNAKGKTIGELKREFNLINKKMKKGASGLIVEQILGIKNNCRDEADLPEIGVEVKVLPLQINRDLSVKAKEPTQIQMINYCDVANEIWETAKIRKKINITFWIVYLAKKYGDRLTQDNYIIIDWYLDHPSQNTMDIFRKDWEYIRDMIAVGAADKLSCSMGVYIEPKTKGKNNRDVTDAPDGKGGFLKARRRAFYYKKKYTNEKVISEIDLSNISLDKK